MQCESVLGWYTEEMEYFSAITDKDIFENPVPEPNEYAERPTSRGIILDKDDLVCLYTIYGRSLFPGGGIEEGESPEQAFIREAKEEAGCDVQIISLLGKTLEFRNKPARKYEIYFFIAQVVGEKGEPTSTQENEQGMVIEWFSKEKALSVLEDQIETLAKDVYMPHFSCRTHLAAFKKFLESECTVGQK